MHNNKLAREGCDRCECGCKYWENDTCVDCGSSVTRTERFTLAKEVRDRLHQAQAAYEAYQDECGDRGGDTFVAIDDAVEAVRREFADLP